GGAHDTLRLGTRVLRSSTPKQVVEVPAVDASNPGLLACGLRSRSRTWPTFIGSDRSFAAGRPRSRRWPAHIHPPRTRVGAGSHFPREDPLNGAAQCRIPS